MKKVLTVLLAIFFIGCNLFQYEEYNPDSSTEVNFLENSHRIVFGTSTGETDENAVIKDLDAGTINIYAKNATNNAGKIAGSEDGISFSYVKVDADKNFKLSADVEVVLYGGIGTFEETTSNGQEGFGLMARDYIPQYPGATMDDLLNSDSYSAGSTGGSGNMILAGAVKRGIRTAIRRGVTGTGEEITDPNVIANASKSSFEYWPAELTDYSPYPTLDDRPDFPLVGGTYKINLERNNNGFIVSFTPPAEKALAESEFVLNEIDLLTEIEPDHYYVGFFASRSAEIIVKNITYTESNAKDDAPYIEPEPEIITPEFSIVSPDKTSDDSYKIYARSNVEGFLSVKQEGVDVPGAEYVAGTLITEPTSSAVEPFMLFDIPVYDLQEGDNIFQVTFHPSSIENMVDDAIMDSIDSISETFIVEKRTYHNGVENIYVSPTGRSSNSGTYDDPLDINTALAFVKAGQTIVMKNGEYNPLSFFIPRYNNGLYGSPKRVVAETRDEVFIDFDKNIYATGAVLKGNYWEIDGVHIRNTPDKKKGFQIMGSNNVISWVKTYNNGDTGLQISGTKTEPKSMWPKNNLIEYCESYNNKDAAQIDADGFAAKLTVGEGNKFSWCVSHNNGDDGWDLFTKKETGTIGVVTLENCITYQNGMLMDGTQTLAGRNGFKLGGEGLSVPHIITNCLAFQNGAHGFTSNSNPGIQITNATSFDNGGVLNVKQGSDSRNFTIYNASNVWEGLDAEIEGLLSLYSEPIYDGEYRKEDKITLEVPADGFFWDGSQTIDKNGNTLTVDDVISTTIPLWNEDFTEAVTEGPGFLKRDDNGEFIIGDFMKLKPAITFDVGADFN